MIETNPEEGLIWVKSGFEIREREWKGFERDECFLIFFLKANCTHSLMCTTHACAHLGVPYTMYDDLALLKGLYRVRLQASCTTVNCSIQL